MAIGVPLNEIKHSTLNTLKLYDDAYSVKKEILDEQMYIMSCYTYKALETSLHNFGLIFDSKHRDKPIDFLDKPFLRKETVKKPLEEMTDVELDAEIQKAIMMEQEYMNKSRLPKTKISKR